MKRRQFFKNAGLFGLGSVLLNPIQTFAITTDNDNDFSNKTPKNIIFLVSDGMSTGTLSMADLFMRRAYGKGSRWLDLYRNNKAKRGLMDMASASSIVTDSSAASSSWGGGHRVKNGRLNVGNQGELYTPIWKKFKAAGKKAGCVTTVPITHATPAGFLINSKSRKDQAGIAKKYLKEDYDVLMGGGHEYFCADERKDGDNVYAAFTKKGYKVVKTRDEMMRVKKNKPLLGVFGKSGLPYTLDQNHTPDLKSKVPTLAEMTQVAIDRMQDHPEGFVLQVEGGKVDWAAHANCVGGLVYDQVAFDEAVGVALDFADRNGETLVIITTDHGNSNPGVNYGKNADRNFDRLQNFKHTNEWILNGINQDFNVSQVVERIEFANGFAISREDALDLLKYYNGLEKGDDGLYNYKHLPYSLLAEIQKQHTNVGWIGNKHSSDYVELAMYGPGSDGLQAFTKNTDLHWYLLEVAGVKV